MAGTGAYRGSLALSRQAVPVSSFPSSLSQSRVASISTFSFPSSFSQSCITSISTVSFASSLSQSCVTGTCISTISFASFVDLFGCVHLICLNLLSALSLRHFFSSVSSDRFAQENHHQHLTVCNASRRVCESAGTVLRRGARTRLGWSSR